MSDDKLTPFLLAEFSPTPLALDLTLDALGLDSLDAIGLVNRLEDALGVAVPNEQFARMRSIGDIYRELGITPPKDFPTA